MLYVTLIMLQGFSGIGTQRRYILAAAMNITSNPIHRQYFSLPHIFTYLHGVQYSSRKGNMFSYIPM